MKSNNNTAGKSASALTRLYVKAGDFIVNNANSMLLVVGVVLLTGGVVELSHAQTASFSEAAYNDELVRNAVAALFELIEGAFGALIMVVAGLGAIVAAAMGAYRLAVSMLVVAVGAFILRALVSLFFGENFQSYTGGTGG